MKESKYVKNNSANPLYLMFHKMNGYFEEVKEKKESKQKIKKYEELWIKIRFN